MDGMIVLSTYQVCLYIKENLSKTFQAKHLGVLTWYMGYFFQHDALRGTLEISKETFTNSFVEWFGVVRESPIPASPAVDLMLEPDDEPQATEPHREA